MVDYKGNGGGIPRNTVKIFANNSANSDCSVFGSKLKDGNSTYSKDTADIQNTEYEVGWRDAVISTKNYPLLSDMNAVLYTLSQQIAGIYQHGVPSYDNSTVYYTYDICNKNGILYIALDDNFSGKNPETETDYWAVFYDPDSSLTAGYNIFLDNSVISASGKYPYSFNNGNVDSSGEADLISYSGADVTYKIGSTYPNLTGTQADGQQFTIDSLADDDVSGLADGSYKKYVGSDGSAELLNNTLSISKTEPSTPSDNDVWINNAVSPLTVKKYIEPNYTVVGSPTITADGIASGFSSTSFIKTPPVSFGNNYIIEGEADFNGEGVFLSLINANNKEVTFNNDVGAKKIKIYQSQSWGSVDITYTGTLTHIEYKLFVDITNSLYRFEYKLNHSGTTQTFDIDNNTIQTILSSLSYAVLGNSGVAWTATWALNGSVDLKQFKIYVNDTLVCNPVFPNGWQPYDKVPLGKITVESGAVTGVESYPYNKDYISNNIVKSYRSGSNGYELHADGYCVQWGRVNGSNSGTVNLSYSYASASAYNIQLTSRREDSTQSITTFVVGDRTASSFDWFGTATYTAGMDWLTTGYVKMF